MVRAVGLWGCGEAVECWGGVVVVVRVVGCGAVGPWLGGGVLGRCGGGKGSGLWWGRGKVVEYWGGVVVVVVRVVG